MIGSMIVTLRGVIYVGGTTSGGIMVDRTYRGGSKIQVLRFGWVACPDPRCGIWIHGCGGILVG